MTALPQIPVSPVDVIDAGEAEQIAQVIQLGAFKSLPPVVDQPEVALPLILGIGVETALLKNQAWDNFWIGVGGRLNDVWHSLTSSLFGSPGVSPVQLRLAVNLSQHITARMIRQLSAQWMGRLGGLSNLTVKGLQSLAAGIRSLSARISQVEREAKAWANQAQHAAEAYALNGLGKLWQRVLQDQAQQDHDLQKWAIDSIYRPLHDGLGQVSQDVTNLRRYVDRQVVPDLEHLFDSKLAKEAALIAAVGAAVAKLTKEAEDCTEPMCETVGPKTDWGKLFKRFSPALLLALLALWEREDPEAVEQASEKLAEVLGPVLESWTRAWFGLGGGDTGPAEKAVEGAAGSFPVA